MDGVLSGVTDERGAALVTAIFTVSIALLCLVVVFWIYKARRPGSAFMAGTRNQSRRRLAVVETLAVDPKRRLVLIRRDGNEHLILIGGPSDIVVEGGIATADIPAVENAASTEDMEGTSEATSPPLQKAAFSLSGAGAALGTLIGESRRRANRDNRAAAPVPPPPPTPPPASAGTSEPLTRPAPRPGRAEPPIAQRPTPSSQQFPPERFGAPQPEQSTTATAGSAGQSGVSAGNPFDASDFGSVLDEEMARTRQSEEQRAKLRPESVDQPKPAVGDQEPERTLEEEMARLLGDISASRK